MNAYVLSGGQKYIRSKNSLQEIRPCHRFHNHPEMFFCDDILARTWMEKRCKRKLRQMKCDVPTSRETQQAQEFRRQQGQTCGLQAIRHIWHTCEARPVQLQTLSKLQVESSTSVCNNC